MYEPGEVWELRPDPLPLLPLETEFDWVRFLVFSGTSVFSLCLWVGIFAAIRLVLR
jgi:hypothetical protein